MGQYAGYNATNNTHNNFFGTRAGEQSTGTMQSNFIGYLAGQYASDVDYSNFIGTGAGYGASTSNYSNFIGANAGRDVTGTTYSNFIGPTAGYRATGSSQSNFIGYSAGYIASGSTQSNFIGNNAGYQAIDSYYSNFIGRFAGQNATNSINCNFIGLSAGNLATNNDSSNFIGQNVGSGATNVTFSNFIGTSTGQNATGSSYSNFIGQSTGLNLTDSDYSNLIGYNVGRTFAGNNIGSNNIIIGTNITLPSGKTNSINIGGVLFGSNTYSSPSGNPTTGATSTGRIGINVVTPTEALHVSGNTLIDGTLTATTLNGGYGGTISLVLGNRNIPIIPGTYPISQFNDEGGYFSDWNFNVAGNGAPIVNLIAAGGTLLSPATNSSVGTYGQITAWGYTSAYTQTAQIDFRKDGTPTTSSLPSKITFSTTPVGSTTMVERVVINNTGKVGINVVTPTEALHVSGNTLVTGNLTATNVYVTGLTSGSSLTNLSVDSTGKISTGNTYQWLYAYRSGSNQTIGVGTWANIDVIFNSKTGTIPYDTSTGIATLTGGRVYKITSNVSWDAAANYLFQFGLYDSSNNLLSGIVEMKQPTDANYDVSSYSLDFIYAPVSDINVKIRTTNNTTALTGETIRYDIQTNFSIHQIG
jgi:hypothetical protein